MHITLLSPSLSHDALWWGGGQAEFHVIDFWRLTRDPSRPERWLPGTTLDPGHPNALGHAHMFSAVDTDALVLLAHERFAAAP
jgi:hypothetical protein